MTEDDDALDPVLFSDDDEDELDVDEILDEGEDLPGFSDGLDPKLAKHLDDITGERKRRTHSVRSRSGDFMGAEPSMDESAGTEAMDFESFEVEIQHDTAETLLKTIYQKLNDAQNEYGRIEELVLGLPQYAALEPWAQAEHGQSIEGVLPVKDVIVVEGPMVHPVVPNGPMLTEHLRGEGG